MAIALGMLGWTACGSSTPATTASGDGGASSSSGSVGSSSGVATGSSSGTSNASSSGSVSTSSSGATAGSSSGIAGGSSGGSSSGATGSSSGAAGSCPATACGAGLTCCAEQSTGKTACVASCATNDVVQCTTPSECADSDAGPSCCGSASLADAPDGAPFPNCVVQTITGYCGQQCPFTPVTTCSGTLQLQVCAAPADCANNTNGATQCCSLDGYSACVSSLVASLAKLTCM